MIPKRSDSFPSMVSAALAWLLLAGVTLPPLGHAGGFMVLMRQSPPLDDPNEWVMVVPTETSQQGNYSAGWHPVPGSIFGSEAAAGAYADGLVRTRFQHECRRAWGVWRNFQTGEVIVIEDAAQPKPFGFTMQKSGLCLMVANFEAGFPAAPVYQRLGRGPGNTALPAMQWTGTGWAILGVTVSRPPRPGGGGHTSVPPSGRVETGGAPGDAGGTVYGEVEDIPDGGGAQVSGGGSPQSVGAGTAGEETASNPFPPIATGDGSTAGGSRGEQVGEEIRYGPFSVTPGQWHSTGIELRKGQNFRVESSGNWRYRGEGGMVFDANGAGGGFYKLTAKVGEELMTVGARGGSFPEKDGVLELGVPKTYTIPNPEDAALEGAYSVLVYVK